MKRDVKFSIQIHGSVQVDEEYEGEVSEVLGYRIEFDNKEVLVGDTEIDIVSIADVDPVTGNLTQRFSGDLEINLN